MATAAAEESSRPGWQSPRSRRAAEAAAGGGDAANDPSAAPPSARMALFKRLEAEKAGAGDAQAPAPQPSARGVRWKPPAKEAAAAEGAPVEPATPKWIPKWRLKQMEQQGAPAEGAASSPAATTTAAGAGGAMSARPDPSACGPQQQQQQQQRQQQGQPKHGGFVSAAQLVVEERKTTKLKQPTIKIVEIIDDDVDDEDDEDELAAEEQRNWYVQQQARICTTPAEQYWSAHAQVPAHYVPGAAAHYAARVPAAMPSPMLYPHFYAAALPPFGQPYTWGAPPCVAERKAEQSAERRAHAFAERQLRRPLILKPQEYKATAQAGRSQQQKPRKHGEGGEYVSAVTYQY